MFQVISVGEKPARWYQDAMDHYLPLVNRYHRCTLLDLKPKRTSSKQSANEVKIAEAKTILSNLKQNTHIVVLDERGQNLTTKELANQISDWKQCGKDTVFIIGGTEGLDLSVIKKAHLKWALSKLTLPHQMAKVMVLEQLFRAQSLLANHPYHR